MPKIAILVLLLVCLLAAPAEAGWRRRQARQDRRVSLFALLVQAQKTMREARITANDPAVRRMQREMADTDPDKMLALLKEQRALLRETRAVLELQAAAQKEQARRKALRAEQE